MTTQQIVTNKALLEKLIRELDEDYAHAKVMAASGIRISPQTVRDMLKRGAVPSLEVREKVANFFKRKECEIFPTVELSMCAA